MQSKQPRAYENGGDIFPPALLRQIQKYAAGRLVYIPAREQERAWGETSGYRRYLRERNREIRARYAAGESFGTLAEAYFLSDDSIRKIIYAKEEDMILDSLDYERTLSSAQAFARAGKLEDWVHTYLRSDGHNQAFSDGLRLFDRTFLGPMALPLHLFSRCCGPEEGMTYRVNAAWFERRVTDLMQTLQTAEDMPPLIAHYAEHSFELNDGNHRFEALTRLGAQEYPFIVWITEEEECAEFLARFGRILESEV
ncbi:MAG: ParB N-terminal domain-containing protein [Oscillospiraceae bacterium]|jgi:hypothetical protein|nr:ParB N-terminal domain-containing protein [Oscillospiraceae bacterium]